MMVNAFSRLRFSTIWTDERERLYLGEREPFRYRSLPDSIQHVVSAGDTLFNIAGRYYAGTPRGAGFWWAIGDFQPLPIHDGTIRLVEATVIVVPSLRVLQTQILNPARRNIVQ